MPNNRLIWADSLKGWLIILVVLGHAIQNALGAACMSNHLWNLIYSFHMPTFMAVSGFFALRKDSPVGGANYFKIIWRRFRQLVVPFFLWTVILLLYYNNLTINTIGEYLLYPDRGLWFLWVLFIISVVFVTGEWMARYFKINQDLVEIGLCVLLSCIMVFLEIRILGFQFIAYYFLFYTLGYLLHKHYNKFITKKVYVLISLVICWFAMAWFWQMHDLPNVLKALPLPTTIIQYMYRFVTASIAIYLLFAIAPSVLNSDNYRNRPFVNLGSISLGIYATHFVFIAKIISYLQGYNLSNTWVVLIAFIFALIISWFIVWLLNKWNITAGLLLGKV